MEIRNATTLESASEDSILIETVKSIVTPEERNNESGCGGEFFLVSQVQGERYSEANVEEAAPQKLPKEEVLVWTDLCRICANTNNRFIPIFEREGTEYDLSNKILKYLPIHVSKSDTLPLQLCYQCAVMLLAWHHLNEECLNAQKRLLKLQNTLQNKHQYYNVTSLSNLEVPTTDTVTTTTIVSNMATSQLDLQIDEEIEEKYETHDIEEINKPNRCGAASEKSFAEYRSSHNAALLRPSNITIKYENATAVNLTPTVENAKEISERDSWDSSDGAVEFEEQTDLNSSRCQKWKSDKTLLSTGKSTTKDYTCDSCKRTFERKCHLMRHKPFCKNSINKENSSTMHVKATGDKRTDDRSVERNNLVQPKKSGAKNTNDDKNQCQNVRSEKSPSKRSGTYPCGYCEHIAEKRELLNVHLKEAHPEFPKQDRISVMDSEMVLRARIEHDGKVYYRCGECGTNMKSPYTFYWHTLIHTGEQLFNCHLCDKRFRLDRDLNEHLREIHIDITKVLCDFCGRMSPSRHSAMEHRRIHTDERPYICPCGKSFRTMSALNRHVQQVHNSVKKFTCDVCSLSLASKTALCIHNRTHTDVFPFKCSYCDKVFRTRRLLRRHIVRHNEKQYVCDVCGRCFYMKYHLKLHLSIHSDFKPWRCTDCDLSFRLKRYLNYHKRHTHGSPRCLTTAAK